MIASGTWGTCPWEISDSGELTIGAGTGANITSFTGVPWYTYRTQIKSARCSGAVVAPSQCFYVFYKCSALASVDLLNFDTSNVTNIGQMFYDCTVLTSLDLSNFDTSKVTNMSYVFSNCSALTSLDLSSFDTSKVTNMSSMFQNCSALISLDISSFNTSNVTNMSYMFFGCSALTSFDPSSFNTSKVTSMSFMFYNCTALTSLDLSNFDTSKVTNVSSMFHYCSRLRKLTLGPLTKIVNSDLPLPPTVEPYTSTWVRKKPWVETPPDLATWYDGSLPGTYEWRTNADTPPPMYIDDVDILAVLAVFQEKFDSLEARIKQLKSTLTL